MSTPEPIEWTAAIVSTDLEPTVLNPLADALRAAGFSRVNLFDDLREVVSISDFKLLETGAGEVKQFRLPDALKGTQYLILDQRIGPHSAFEVNLILRAAEKENNVTVAHCILIDPADPIDKQAMDITVFASWLSGFDLCLSKPVNPEEFRAFAKRIRESLANPSE